MERQLFALSASLGFMKELHGMHKSPLEQINHELLSTYQIPLHIELVRHLLTYERAIPLGHPI